MLNKLFRSNGKFIFAFNYDLDFNPLEPDIVLLNNYSDSSTL